MIVKLSPVIAITFFSAFLSCKTVKKNGGSGLADTGFSAAGRACAEAAKCDGAAECLAKEKSLRDLEKGELIIAAKLTRYLVLLNLENPGITQDAALDRAYAELGIIAGEGGSLKYAAAKDEQSVEIVIAAKKASVFVKIAGLSQAEKEKLREGYIEGLNGDAERGNRAQSANEARMYGSSRGLDAADFIALANQDTTAVGKALFLGLASTALSSQSRLYAAAASAPAVAPDLSNGPVQPETTIKTDGFDEVVATAKIIQASIADGVAKFGDAFDSVAAQARFELAKTNVVVGVFDTQGNRASEMQNAVVNVFGGSEELVLVAGKLAIAVLASREAEIISQSPNLKVSEAPAGSIAAVLRRITEPTELKIIDGETLETTLKKSYEVIERVGGAAGAEKLKEEAEKQRTRILEKLKHK